MADKFFSINIRDYIDPTNTINPHDYFITTGEGCFKTKQLIKELLESCLAQDPSTEESQLTLKSLKQAETLYKLLVSLRGDYIWLETEVSGDNIDFYRKDPRSLNAIARVPVTQEQLLLLITLYPDTTQEDINRIFNLSESFKPKKQSWAKIRITKIKDRPDLDDQVIQSIRQEYLTSKTAAFLADKHGISITQVYKLCRDVKPGRGSRSS